MEERQVGVALEDSSKDSAPFKEENASCST